MYVCVLCKFSFCVSTLWSNIAQMQKPFGTSVYFCQCSPFSPALHCLGSAGSLGTGHLLSPWSPPALTFLLHCSTALLSGYIYTMRHVFSRTRSCSLILHTGELARHSAALWEVFFPVEIKDGKSRWVLVSPKHRAGCSWTLQFRQRLLPVNKEGQKREGWLLKGLYIWSKLQWKLWCRLQNVYLAHTGLGGQESMLAISAALTTSYKHTSKQDQIMNLSSAPWLSIVFYCQASSRQSFGLRQQALSKSMSRQNLGDRTGWHPGVIPHNSMDNSPLFQEESV